MRNKDRIIVEAGEIYTVDAAYIKKALDGLKSIKNTNKFVYDNAVKYLDNNKGRYLVVTPEEFAARRLKLAAAGDGDAEPKSVDTSRIDLMKSVADKNKAAAAAPGPKEQVIKSIWVKSLDDVKGVLELEYADGSKETIETDAAFDEKDRYFKEMASLLRSGRRTMKTGWLPVNKRDVLLAMICAPYNDGRIEWFFGKNRKPKSAWKYGIVILDKHNREAARFKELMRRKEAKGT